MENINFRASGLPVLSPSTNMYLGSSPSILLLRVENCSQNPTVKSISNANFSSFNLIPSFLHHRHPTLTQSNQKTLPHQEKVHPSTPLKILLVSPPCFLC